MFIGCTEEESIRSTNVAQMQSGIKSLPSYGMTRPILVFVAMLAALVAIPRNSAVHLSLSKQMKAH
jgi:hypothetical protein